MSDITSAAALHLKLDRLLAAMEGVAAKQEEQDESIKTLTAGLDLLKQGQDDMRAAIEELTDAADEEGDGELREVLLRLTQQMEQMVADGTRMVTVINGLPRAMSDAAMDAVRLALGEAIDPRP